MNPMKMQLFSGIRAIRAFITIMLLYVGTSVYGQNSGVASYYSDIFEGRQTANGEIFCRDSMTAAHKTLPFGTIVRVIDPNTGKSVEVRINDRLPQNSTRLIDLSPCAARELQMIRRGLLPVRLEISD